MGKSSFSVARKESERSHKSSEKSFLFLGRFDIFYPPAPVLAMAASERLTWRGKPRSVRFARRRRRVRRAAGAAAAEEKQERKEPLDPFHHAQSR